MIFFPFSFLFQLLLNNGSLISILVSSSSGDVERISIDKSLTGKVPDLINKGMAYVTKQQI